MVSKPRVASCMLKDAVLLYNLDFIIIIRVFACQEITGKLLVKPLTSYNN